MPNNGILKELDISSVKTKSDKTVTYLRHQLPNLAKNKQFVVVFLGEQHGNTTDQAVTQAVLAAPPVVRAGATRVIYERQLDNVYVHGAGFSSARTEPTNLAQSRKERSKVIADMIDDAFTNHAIEVVYVPCGSAHSKEVFNALDKVSANKFYYVAKPSSTD